MHAEGMISSSGLQRYACNGVRPHLWRLFDPIRALSTPRPSSGLFGRRRRQEHACLSCAHPSCSAPLHCPVSPRRVLLPVPQRPAQLSRVSRARTARPAARTARAPVPAPAMIILFLSARERTTATSTAPVAGELLYMCINL